MFFFTQILEHLKPITTWARANQAATILYPDSFSLGVKKDGLNLLMNPRFVALINGQWGYTSSYREHECGFVGWLPYSTKRWQLSSEKLAFKQYAATHGLPTPRHWFDGPCQAENFVIKPTRGSFGHGIRGPFRADEYDQVSNTLADGEYFEEYVIGRSTKIWYWSGVPYAMEAFSPPMLYGDGRRTLREIASTRRGTFERAHDLSNAQAVLHWQRLTPDTILADGATAQIDFRHVSAYDPIVLRDRESLSLAAPDVRTQTQHIGRVLHLGIPEQMRANTLFTVDAMLDAHDRLWLLEMNSNPVVHPKVYGAMLDEVFTMQRQGQQAIRGTENRQTTNSAVPAG
ncbi:hypothetical protein [Ralstonia pseudosolanacearum]|uniref:hypothetical protein n=1 Tax=Ralstonia pseudosolanacearum TaxID=1310165 RepID=UPI003CE954F1